MVTTQGKTIFHLYFTQEGVVGEWHVCRQHPDIADQKSGMFIGKIVGRRDTLSSAKHAACLMKDSNKSKQVTGLMYKAIAKVHEHEPDRTW
jgi:hypothetical protein